MAASNTEKLLDLYIAGRLSDEMNSVVQGWLLSDTPEQDSYLRRLFDRLTGQPRIIVGAYTRRSLKVLEYELGFRDMYAHAQWLVRHTAVAVLVLAVMLGGAVAYSLLRTPHEAVMAMQTVVGEAGSTRTVAFPDGTSVTLKGASRIAFAGDYAENRRITLDGEAYFDVARDADRPFRVSGGGVDVEVLGTEFNMHTSHSDNVAEIVLVEGSVGVSTPERQVLLAPGQRVEVDIVANTMEVEPVSHGVLARHSGHPLVFDDVALDEVLRSIGDYFEVRMEIAASVPQVERVVFDIGADASLEQAMKLLQATNPVFKYEITDGTVRVR